MTRRSEVTRREMLKGTGGMLAAAALPLGEGLAEGKAQGTVARPPAEGGADITGQLARYMVESRDRDLPVAVARETKHHILDTLAAIVSGSTLKPGEMAVRYVRTQGGVPESSVFTTDIKTSAVNAALANAMFAHADETDDFEPFTKAHPGCSTVPAAFAVAEREDRSGLELLRAVTLGYDVCCRFLMALGPDHVRATHRSAEGVSSNAGAVAAAASLARLDETGTRYAISYSMQQVSGVWSWERDAEHVEKAFDFAGMGARNGVTAAMVVQAGWTGVRDVLEGEHNALEAMSTQPKPAEMIAGLGTRFWVMETAIKTFSVGYPIQAPADALLSLRKEHGLTPANVARIVVKLPADGAGIVNNRAMPDVNVQHMMAVALIDGTISFDASHSYERMSDPQVRAVKERVELIADRSLMDPLAPRSGLVEVTLRDGRMVSKFTRFAPGTKENPLDTAGVSAKARALMEPVIGAQRTEAIIQRVNALEDVAKIRDLVRLLTV